MRITRNPDKCEGHPAGPFDPMGETVYCDGSCNPPDAGDLTYYTIWATADDSVGVLFYIGEDGGADNANRRDQSAQLVEAPVHLRGVIELPALEDDLRAGGVTPDGSYLEDLEAVRGELSTAHNALTAIVARGIADHDSDAGRIASDAADEIGGLLERTYAATVDPDYRTAGLLRGSR